MAGKEKRKGLGCARRGPPTSLGTNGGARAGLSKAERELRASGERPRLIRNKRRAIQYAPTRRKLFKGKVKARFLEWFAATANISLSACKAGIHYRTVLRHRMEDAVFAEEMAAALEVGIVRVKAWALEWPEEAGTEIALEKVDMKPVNLTPEMALQLIREPAVVPRITRL